MIDSHHVESSIPEGLTIAQYRRTRTPRRRGFLYRLTHRSAR